MTKKTDVIIIGAGPAGLMAANQINRKTIILEKNKQPGKKMLIAGAGQCNYTNNIPLKAFFSKYGSHKRFVQYGLSKFTNKDSIEFFNKKGVKSIIRPDQKVFPASLDSKDILKAFLESLEHLIVYNSQVTHIEKRREEFIVKSTTGTYKAKQLVIATGGHTYPQTGSAGDGYDLARLLNIPVTTLHNGLCSVQIDRNLSSLAGITLKSTVGNIYRDNKKIKEVTGDLLITHNGLSGPMVINNARDIKQNDLIKINFIGETYQDFDEKLIKLSQKHSKKDIINAMKILNLPNRLLEYLIKDIDYHKNIAALSKKDRKMLSKVFTNGTFKVLKVGSKKNAMVTVGGIDLNAINRKTMAVKDHANLYFIGEVLDIDGDTGGFNIQWAFSSGYLASYDINNK